MRRAPLLLLPLAFLTACDAKEPDQAQPSTEPAAHPAPSDPTTEPTPDPTPEPTTEPAAQPAAEAAATPSTASLRLPEPPGPGPMRFDPETAYDSKLPHDVAGNIDPEEGPMSNHLASFGWNTKSKVFRACGMVMGDRPPPCVYAEVDGETITLEGEGGEKKTWEAHGPFEARGAKEWSRGAGIRFTHESDGMKVRFGAELSDGPDKGKGKPRILTWTFDDEQFDGGIAYVEAVGLSPDGETLAVVAHAGVGEIEDEWSVRLVGADQLATQVYAKVGFDHLDEKRYEDAARSFALATALDQAWKHPYNLACARSLGGLEDVEPALAEALRRGGDPVRTKIRSDKDLDPVREQDWFKALLK